VNLQDILSVDTGRKPRRRVGRGMGSGLGKTGGRGSKGEGSRTGGKNRNAMFEGGQFRFWQKLPIRGFTNSEHTDRYQAIDFARVLERVEGDITMETLVEAGLVRSNEQIKLLGKVEVSRVVNVSVHRVSASVRQAVEAAGGTVTELHPRGEA